jgi:hypothetical protein
MKHRLVSPKLIVLGILVAGPLTTGHAINIRNREGKVIELANLTGTVTRVDQARHTFTLTWKNKSTLKMERYWPSYSEDYSTTAATIYKKWFLGQCPKGYAHQDLRPWLLRKPSPDPYSPSTQPQP